MAHRSEVDLGIIAIALSTFDCAGAQRDIILLSNALAAKGIPIALLVLRDEGPLRSLIDPRIRVIEIPGRRIRYAIPGLRKIICSIAPRLILSSGSNLNLCCLAAVRSLPRKRRPKVMLREVATPSVAERQDPHWQDRIAYRILRRVYRHADRVVTLTDGARRDLVENFSIPARKVATMRSNAVITPEIAERIAGWDGEQGREPNLIVSVGRLSPEKNHRLLLRALALMGPDRPWRLALVGDGPERPALESFVRKNGLSKLTTFVGYVNDPFEWMMRDTLPFARQSMKVSATQSSRHLVAGRQSSRRIVPMGRARFYKTAALARWCRPMTLPPWLRRLRPRSTIRSIGRS